MVERKYAVIVAGGSGTRMGTDIPKQFLLLNNKPVLMHTLERFYYFSSPVKIILVLPSSQIETWKQLCSQYDFAVEHIITAGGATRFESVQNGLAKIDDPNGLVAIHDGVRPFPNSKLIEETFLAASKYGNGVAAVPLKDSIRSVSGELNTAEDRNKFRIIQTPQTFQVSLIKKAFEQANHVEFTDDASVLEAIGEKIVLTGGNYGNIKITTPEDLIMAEAILKNFRY